MVWKVWGSNEWARSYSEVWACWFFTAFLDANEASSVCRDNGHMSLQMTPSHASFSIWLPDIIMNKDSAVVARVAYLVAGDFKSWGGKKKNQKLTSNSASHTCGWLRLKMFFTLGNTSCLHNEKYSMVCVRRDPSVQDITEARWSENVKTWTNTEKLTGISKSLGEKSFNKEERQVRSHFSKKTRGHCWPRVMVQMNRAQNA